MNLMHPTSRMLTTLLLCLLLLTGCLASGTQEPDASVTSPTLTPSPDQRLTVSTELIQPAADPTLPPVPPTETAPQPDSAGAAGSALAAPNDELAALAAAQRLPHNRVLLARAFTDNHDAPMVARTEPLDVQVGHVKEFWVNDIVGQTNYPVMAELRYSGSVVLMYVEQGVQVDQAGLERAARDFEERIYPRTRQLFGSEWQPGVDGDLRIVILNLGTIQGGVAGYFSSRDSVPQEVNRFSNEHEMFYMNVGALEPGSSSYLDTLAHEFQHMIHWNEQRQSNTWFNEGNSTLSEDLNGFATQRFVSTYLSRPDTQLTAWGELPGASLAHYGAAHLFMRYIYAHYAGEAALADLVRSNAGNNLDAFVQLAARQRPYIDDFGTLFADWAVANLVNDPALADGRYGYDTEQTGFTLLPRTIDPMEVTSGVTQDTVHQFGVDYLAVPAGSTLRFDGESSVNLVGALPQDSYAWWSGRSDNSLSTLTRSFDLRGVERATLRFATWYEIEQGYDYAFVSISTDGGTGWQTLSGSHTTTDDPHGANYGHGLTGVSGRPGQPTSIPERGRWLEEQIDLTPYAGQQVQLRFWQVNDEGFNAPGILIDNIAIPEIGYSDNVEAGAGGWQAEGFVRVDGTLEQEWALRLVRTAADGSIQVEPLATDEAGAATATLAPGESAVLVVAATTPYTTEPASYTVTVE